ncbi:class B sortase [Clostridium sp.]|uniref:class B sortase n=1 Tax=Clostridium sp. TaxID=1506 RepID=UPI003F40B15C
MSRKFKVLARNLLLIVAIIVFIISLINVYSGIKEYYKNHKLYNDINSLNPFNSNDLNVAYTKLKDLNEDYVGWLYIPNTNINYPIVKGIDNSFYLNHNFLKEESKSGAIFIDCNVNEFEDRNTIIYSHYMKDGSMFADLHKIYSDLDNSFKIYVATDNEVLKYDIFSLFKDSADINNYQTFWSDDEYLEYLNTLSNKSNINYNASLNINSNIITLSTCDFNYSNGRLLVIAVLGK